MRNKSFNCPATTLTVRHPQEGLVPLLCTILPPRMPWSAQPSFLSSPSSLPIASLSWPGSWSPRAGVKWVAGGGRGHRAHTPLLSATRWSLTIPRSSRQNSSHLGPGVLPEVSTHNSQQKVQVPLLLQLPDLLSSWCREKKKSLTAHQNFTIRFLQTLTL